MDHGQDARSLMEHEPEEFIAAADALMTYLKAVRDSQKK
jgi:hypothetical protein